MALTPELEDLIRAWEGETLARGEFSAQMMGQVWKLLPATRHAALEELSTHADESVRQAASECRLYLHNEDLSRNLDYVRQHSPLHPGARLVLFGGYDYYSSEGKPFWLNGRDHYKATFLSFAPRGEDVIPAGVVEFDEAIDVPGYKGRYGILLSSCGLDFVAWTLSEADVVVYVAEALPQDISAFRFDGRASPDPIETHATYRIEASV